MYELILVSQSPRRREILARTGYKFRCDTVKVSEIINENLNLDEAIMDLARQKSIAYIDAHKYLKSQKILLLSADTVVVFQDQVLGKPKDRNDAFTTLSMLSGKEHCVKTGICVYDLYTCSNHCEIETTVVEFHTLSNEQISNYVASGDGDDKAGAYGIQGEAGKFVAKRVGDFDNVVGFPLKIFKEMIEKNGWDIDIR